MAFGMNTLNCEPKTECTVAVEIFQPLIESVNFCPINSREMRCIRSVASGLSVTAISSAEWGLSLSFKSNSNRVKSVAEDKLISAA